MANRFLSPSRAARARGFIGNLGIACWAFFAAIPAGPAHAADPPAPRPNVLVIRSDDQARWAVGFYGNAQVRTPNIDRLMREGAAFMNAFATTPVCSPSRVAFLTGLHSFQAGIPDWIEPKDLEHGVAPEFVTLPEAFDAAGYRTAMFGKWHLGYRPEHHPARNGFDKFAGMIGGGQPPRGGSYERFGEQVELGDRFLDEAVTEDLLAELGEAAAGARDGSAPFFMMLDLRAPHAPYAPAPAVDEAVYAGAEIDLPAGVDIGKFPAERLRQLRREYFAACSSVDREVGRALARLDELGLASNTIVVFTSDHGYMLGEHGLWHKGNATSLAAEAAGARDPRVRRPNMFDDSLRVPLAARWPGHIPPGTRVEAHVLQIDLYPTLVKLAGIAMPPLPASQPIAGLDASAWLLGSGGPAAWRTATFHDYDMRQGKRSSMRAIRSEPWKLILHEAEEGGANELYNLQDDPGETRNLWNDPAAENERSRLEAELRNWRDAMKDPTR